LLAFVRLTTKQGLFPSPLPPSRAIGQVADWLSAPSATLVTAGGRHVDILSRLVEQLGTGGNLVNDAHLAALALEQRAAIVSYDSDFARFDGVSWATPDELLA